MVNGLDVMIKSIMLINFGDLFKKTYKTMKVGNLLMKLKIISIKIAD